MDTIHTTPVPQSASVADSTSDDTNILDQTNSLIDNGKKQAIEGVENVGEVFKSLIKNTGSTVTDLKNETEKSLKDIAKASGRVTLGLGYLCSQLFNALSATVATSSGYLANGVRNIDDAVGEWPVVGFVTGTLDAVTTQVANAVNEMSANGRKSRQKMIDALRKRLDESSNLGASTVSTTSSGSVAANKIEWFV